MKKIGIIVLLTAVILQGFSQEVESKEKQAVKDSAKNETVRFAIGDDLFSVTETGDRLKIRLGDNGLTILESLEEGSRFKLEKYKDNDDIIYRDEDDDERKSRSGRRFRGNWSGFEFGFNNWMVDDFSTVMPDDIYYMTLHTGKSNSFSFNFVQQSAGLTRHLGIVTGLGLEWNNYRFDGNNNIAKNDLGQIIELDPGINLKKSRLKTIYLNIPALLQLNIPADHKHISIAAGVIGGVKLCSQTKMVTDDDDKIKSNSDFSLNVLRWGPTARMGFGNFQIFGTYYMTPMFRSGKGPGLYNLYPYEIGCAFTFND